MRQQKKIHTKSIFCFSVCLIMSGYLLTTAPAKLAELFCFVYKVLNSWWNSIRCKCFIVGDDPQLLSSYHEMQNRLLKKGCVRYAKEWSPFSDLSANKTWLECLAGIWPKNLKRCAAVSYFPTFFCARKLILYSVFLTKRARAWVSITRFAKASLLWPPYSRNCCRVPCITGCPGKICMLKLIFYHKSHCVKLCFFSSKS